MRQVRARNGEPHRLCAGRKQELVVRNRAAIGERQAIVSRVDRRDIGRQPQIDMVVAVEIIRPQRQPVFRRAAGEIVLRQVRPVDRRRLVVAFSITMLP